MAACQRVKRSWIATLIEEWFSGVSMNPSIAQRRVVRTLCRVFLSKILENRPWPTTTRDSLEPGIVPKGMRCDRFGNAAGKPHTIVFHTQRIPLLHAACQTHRDDALGPVGGGVFVSVRDEFGAIRPSEIAVSRFTSTGSLSNAQPSACYRISAD
jgi:hypothetical protein